MDNFELVRDRRSSLIAPAGCGKTHLIADMVSSCNFGKKLILTHTHAGVDSLRKKLKKVGAKENSYSIETIAGFSLKYVCAYPFLSGQKASKPSNIDEWDQTYKAMSKLLQFKNVQDVIRLSYSGFYVDEYQDCCKSQHELVLNLTKTLSTCLVLGDPLQSIFNFSKAPTVNWETEVDPHFTQLSPLKIPHRWKQNGGCIELGEWLLKIRENFKNGSPIDLSQSPRSVTHIQMDNNLQGIQAKQCFELQKLSGSSIAINSQREQNYTLMNRLVGFSCLEPIEFDELFKYCEEIEKSSGLQRVLKAIELAGMCLMASKILNPLKRTYANGKPYSDEKTANIKAAFDEILNDNRLELVERALSIIRKEGSVKIRRSEFFFTLISAIYEHKFEKYESLKDAAWHIRNKMRLIGRGESRCVLGTTLLVKGLEYDHCLILDADKLKPEELYVAMTRGSRSLTIISKSHILHTRNPANERRALQEQMRLF